ncbi:peptidase [Bacillus phage PBC2]|uniref:M23 peptidase domain containing protein n=1 Tax=Bacillus phage PBC2 TaxID=1675029 RepID=A0A218KCF2_9CAUD|nr:peptidase [Bacillus phage PBC2]AKQ08560.1 M23 peptidase domain containing protein [Bacillus phage PBC2]
MKVKLNGNYSYEVSSPFGSVDSVHNVPHTGIDLIMESGTKLYSPVDGIVEKVVDYGNQNIGKGVIIKTNQGETVIMGHMSDTSATQVGEELSRGEFIGLSGNTGFSTGSHLHVGLKDVNGNFVNPDKLLNDNYKKMLNSTESLNPIEDKNWFEFINDWRKEGFFNAMYGKDFFDVMKDTFIEFFRDLGQFIVQNSDLFFLLPAIILMFATFFIGKNKYSKFIIPLWMGYFVTSILNKIYM